VMSAECSVDIDGEMDWRMAEMIMTSDKWLVTND
jgi:CMP-N-acetylneuraminic acid synthetase